jgi:hypothetical protein
MFSANRRLVRAKEESAKALLRSAAAKHQIADTLREMMRDEDGEAAAPPPLPRTDIVAAKRQSPRK